MLMYEKGEYLVYFSVGSFFLMSFSGGIHAVVQFYPWFKVYFPLSQTHFQHYHTQEQYIKKKKFKPRVNLNRKIYTRIKPLCPMQSVNRKRCDPMKLWVIHTYFIGSSPRGFSESIN